jgi:hypothetical protein
LLGLVEMGVMEVHTWAAPWTTSTIPICWPLTYFPGRG